MEIVAQSKILREGQMVVKDQEKAVDLIKGKGVAL